MNPNINTKITKALAAIVRNPRHWAWLRDNDPKTLEQAERALQEVGIDLPDMTLSFDEVAALRECVGMAQSCSTPDTALSTRVGRGLVERGFVIEVTDPVSPNKKRVAGKERFVRWYTITPKGRKALNTYTTLCGPRS